MQIQFNRYAGDEPSIVAAGLPDGADALIFTKAARKFDNISVFIARDDRRAASFFSACQFYAPDIEVLMLPAWDCLPYDRVSPSRDLAAKRASTLFNILSYMNDKPLIIISTISAVTQKLIPQKILSSSGLTIKTGSELKRNHLQKYLIENGFIRETIVRDPGDYAIRGGIVDIFPIGFESPVRLDFFGDDIDSIRSFDSETQRTKIKLNTVTFTPVSEVLLTTLSTGIFRRNYIATFGGGVAKDPIYSSIVAGIRPQGIEHYLPLFYDKVETIFDYLPSGSLISFDCLISESLSERQDLIEDYYSSRMDYVNSQDTGSGDPAKLSGLYRPLPVENLYIQPNEWRKALSNFKIRNHTLFTPPDTDNKIDFGGRLGRNFSNERKRSNCNVFDEVIKYINYLKDLDKKVLIASHTDGSSERLGSVLADHGLVIPEIKLGSEALAINKSKVYRIKLPLETGFEIDDFIVISEQDIFGDRLINSGRKRRTKNFISEVTSLNTDDLIIHIDHGLGRYIGLETISVRDAPHDCLKLEYFGGSTLYLPVENIELLSRYGSAPENITLDKLGSAAWQSRKAKAKKRLLDIAGELIIIAAKRATKTCEAISIDQNVYNEFCSKFPYAETEDQISSIDEVLSDLQSGKPMDRLICGDVGFGKTEVALRAAFAVVMSGKQVAIVAPTTILSRQHFKTFSERFKDLPVSVKQLSRMVSSREQILTKNDLSKGHCDIVVGTHSLLSKSLKFSDLGLIIVDEEQRFGVQHKERLKQLRSDLHVLTLTATPIPRTLQMALSGIRDLSLIATPPVDRLAVRTYISPFDIISIRKAILRERYRGGQCFFVVPRISDIKKIDEFMQVQVPEVTYVIAHGQMSPNNLEEIMTAFYNGQYDVLISTSIIESGIDIPTANTMIVYRADRFGLAQLYQMRGRVGRSKLRAYAYFTMPDNKLITKGAQNRLKVFQSLDTLGAGFSLASHDLDIRGSGNPLGQEQSGHIKDLGVELYQHMLEEAVSELKDDGYYKDNSWSPQVNVGVAILIPEKYIEDLNLRLSIYRRISAITTDDEGNALSSELIDRFGPLPVELESLLTVMKIKRLCKLSCVEKVDVGPFGIVITIRSKEVSDPSKILNAITKNPGWRLRENQTILIKGNFEKAEFRLAKTLKVIQSLYEKLK